MTEDSSGLFQWMIHRYGRRWRRIRQTVQKSNFEIEAFEPRLLLSADVLSVPLLDPYADGQSQAALVLTLEPPTTNSPNLAAPNASALTTSSIHDLLTEAISRLSELGLDREQL